jgi:hypothetical protein
MQKVTANCGDSNPCVADPGPAVSLAAERIYGGAGYQHLLMVVWKGGPVIVLHRSFIIDIHSFRSSLELNH